MDSDEEIVPETSSDEEGDKVHFTQYTKNDSDPQHWWVTYRLHLGRSVPEVPFARLLGLW